MWRKGFSPLVPGLARRPTDQILEVSLFVARGQIGLKRLDTGFIIFHKADLSASVAEWVVLINILRIKEISFYTDSHYIADSNTAHQKFYQTRCKSITWFCF